MNKIPDFYAVIMSTDFSQEQAAACFIEPTFSGKVDITISTPISIDTTRRDLLQDISVALEFNRFHEIINEIYTINDLRP